jgi:hypothetical protein
MKKGTKKAIRKVARTLVFGTLALAVLLVFVGPFLGLIATITQLMIRIFGLSMDLPLRGIVQIIKILFKLIPLFLVVWVITKIPGLEGLIERWVDLGKNLAGQVWDLRLEPEERAAKKAEAHEVAKGHAVAFGSLPNGQKANTEEDRQILREAYAEVDKLLNDPDEKWVMLEKKVKVRTRIAEQLGMKLELETEEETCARIEAAKQAEAEAEAAQAEADAQALAEAEEEAAKYRQ